MHMPDAIPENMFAPCGMNCMVCYKHCTVCKSVRPCAGCLNGDEGKPRHCRACAIRDCCREKGLRYCLECTAFPCRRLNRLEKSYRTRYDASLLSNSRAVLTRGLAVFLENERQKYTCSVCGGIVSLHDGVCGTCGASTAALEYKHALRGACRGKRNLSAARFLCYTLFVAASVSAHKGAGTPGGRGKIRAAAAGMK